MIGESGEWKIRWLVVAGLLLCLGVIFGCSLVSVERPTSPLGETTPEQLSHKETLPTPLQTRESQALLTPAGNSTQPLEQKPTATQQPTPTPTSVPVLFPLTQGGCCVQPFWAPDSQRVLFLDKPIASLPAGLWGIGLDGGVPELFSQKIGIYSPGLTYRAYLENDATWVEHLADGQLWQIANDGRQVYFSTDETNLAWSSSSVNIGLREVWISRVDGSQAQSVYTSAGASVITWLADGRLLIQEQSPDGSRDQALSVLSLASQPEEQPRSKVLARGFRLRSPLASPDGSWIAYYSAFDDESEKNGLWLVNSNTAEKRRLALFGAYRWRNASQVLVIPLDLEQPEQRIWQVAAETGAAVPITDPAITPFKVSGGDWQVSPDGQWMTFVSADDNNIWLMKLP